MIITINFATLEVAYDNPIAIKHIGSILREQILRNWKLKLIEL